MAGLPQTFLELPYGLLSHDVAAKAPNMFRCSRESNRNCTSADRLTFDIVIGKFTIHAGDGV